MYVYIHIPSCLEYVLVVYAFFTLFTPSFFFFYSIVHARTQSAFPSLVFRLCSLLSEIEHKRQTVQLKLHNESTLLPNARLIYVIMLNPKAMSMSERKYINGYFCNIVINR